jgi:hypothetical protein
VKKIKVDLLKMRKVTILKGSQAGMKNHSDQDDNEIRKRKFVIW